MTTTLITGGQVITFDSAVPEAKALVLSDGRVVAMGDRRDMEDVAGPDADRVDAGGGAVLPGLVDTHPHAMHFGMLAGGLVDLTDAVDHADIVARIRAKAAETPAGEWIMCTPVGSRITSFGAPSETWLSGGCRTAGCWTPRPTSIR